LSPFHFEEGRGFYLFAAASVNLNRLTYSTVFFPRLLPEGRGFYFVAALGVNIPFRGLISAAQDLTLALLPVKQNHPPTTPPPARFPPPNSGFRFGV
jgi:hypothetical protein